MEAKDVIDNTFETSKEVRFSEHELLISFNNDSGAEAFQDWYFSGGGEKAFLKYTEKNIENYKH